MNGRDKRQERRWARRAAVRERGRQTQPLCPNGCGQPGPHFVPPSLGQPGFYSCEPKG